MANGTRNGVGSNGYDYGTTYDANNAAADNGSAQGGAQYGSSQVASASGASGVRAGSSSNDPWISYWQGGATPDALKAAQSTGTQAAGVNGQVTGAQGALLSQLQEQAMGRGPSVAAAQAQQTTQANIKGAAALAASGRGNPGAASYNAVQAAGSANQTAAGQAAIARTQEELGAQSNLAGLTGQMGGQQLQNNEFNANLGQQNNQFNAGAQNAQNQFYNTMMQQQAAQTAQYEENKDISRTNNNAQMVNGLVSDRRQKKKIKAGGMSLDGFFDKVGRRKAVY